MDELVGYLTGNATLLVAACALFLTINGSRATRRHNRLSVQPRLSAFAETTENAVSGVAIYKVALRNSGLGPAFIKRFEVLWDGNVLKVDSPEDFQMEVSKNVPAHYAASPRYFSVLRKDYVMAKDSSVEVVSIGIHNATPFHALELKRFQLRVVFESAYGEHFVYDTRTHTAKA